METGRQNIDGINIAYVRRGEGTPLVLIHGYPLDHTIWEGVAPLLEQDFEMIIPDLRGFGESEVMEADHSITSYASDITGLLDHFKMRKALVAGHSMGGYVALAFAREFPERVAGLGLISSQILPDKPDRKAARYDTSRQVLAEGVGSVAQVMAPMLSADAAIQSLLRDLMAKQQPLAVSSALQAMADRPDSTEIFRAFKFPVLIIHGQSDALIPVERGREMHAALGSAHYVELEGVGHMPMMEDASATADALRFFLNVRATGVKLLDA